MPEISVIIPNYNHGPFLRERIESVLGQSYRDFELIIIDDASTDNSREIILSYGNHPKVSHIIYNESNSGSPFIQWKKGIERASGRWIWIAESDDFAAPEFLNIGMINLQKNPGASLFYCDAHVIKEKNNQKNGQKTFAELKNSFFKTEKWSSEYFIEGKQEINDCMKFACTINNTSSMLFKKELLVGMIKENHFTYHGDWYYELKMASCTNICYSAAPLNFFRLHPNNHLNSKDLLQSKKEYFIILEFLYAMDFVTSKRKLIHFFSRQYLGFGILSDGLKHGLLLFRSYRKLNKLLAIKVLFSILIQKILNRKRKATF